MQTMIWKQRVLFLFLLWSHVIWAQPSRTKYLSLEDGLSSVHVIDIAHDKQGFVWVATELGLNRFASNSFRHYYKNESLDGTSVNSNEINKLLYDESNDQLYVGTRSNGLNILDLRTNKFTYHMHDPDKPGSIATNDITDMLLGEDKNLWLTTYHQGLQYFDVQNGQFTHYNKSTIPAFPDNSIWSLAKDQNGLLYLGLVNKGLVIFDPKTKRIEHLTAKNTNFLLPHDEVKVVYADQKNNIWLGTRRGLAVFRPDTKEIKRIDLHFSNSQNNPFVYAIQEIGDHIWIGTDASHVFVLSSKDIWSEHSSPKIERWDLDMGNHMSIQRILPDRFGNVWLANYGIGLGFISHIPSFFKTFSSHKAISDARKNRTAFSGIVHDQEAVWLATEGKGLIYWSPSGTTVYSTENSGLRDNYIYSLLRDSHGRLWMGLYHGGISIYDHTSDSWQFVDYNGQLADIWALHEDTHGDIWIGSKNGVFIYDTTQDIYEKIVISNSTLGDFTARSMVEDERGNMWIGTYGQGIFIYDKEKKQIKTISKEDGLPSNTINYLFKDSKKNIWIATNEGFSIIYSADWKNNPKNIKPPKPDPWLFVHAISEDKKGNIWLSTNSGLMRYLPSENRFFYYDHTFGVPLGEFKNNSVAINPQGEIFFGGQTDLIYFQPEQIPLHFPKPPLSFGRFTVFQTKTGPKEMEIGAVIGESLELAHYENSVRIEINVMDYAMYGLMDYSYQLHGLNHDWHDLGSEQNIDFRNLPYGRYELRVRTKLQNEDWDDEYIHVNFEIVPPFYWTIYAKVIYVLIVLSILSLILFFYKRKIGLETELKMKGMEQEQQQRLYSERLNFFTNITHELRTPLTLILGPLEDLLQEKKLSINQNKMVQMIHKSANRLFGLVNQLLEFRKVEAQHKELVLGAGYLGELVKDVVSKYVELNNKNVEIQCVLPEKELKSRYDAEIITVVLDNLLSNAYKHTSSGMIRVTLSYTNEHLGQWIVLSVKDTGTGMNKEYQEKVFDRFFQIPNSSVGNGTGLGLSLIKDLITIHHGRIKVSSEEGKGSEFVVRIPTLILQDRYTDKWRANDLDESDTRDDEGLLLILLVEDDPDLRQYTASMLSSSYRVLEAEDGRQGLAIAQEYIPDMVITDVMMPDMDGYEMVEKLRDQRSTSHIPVIMLTARDTTEDKIKGYHLGVDSYLTKPITASLLLERLRNIIDRRKAIYDYMNQHEREIGNMQKETLVDTLDPELVWKENKFVQEVIKLIEERIQEHVVDAHSIADGMNMSQSTLYRKLKALTGKNINQFVRKIRMQKAAELLKDGQYNVTEVSFMVGINSVIYFRQCFKEEFGLLPSEYQKKH